MSGARAPIDQVKRAARAARLTASALESSIVAAHADGATLRQIADAAGMTPEGIRQILKRYGVTQRAPGRPRKVSEVGA